MWLDRHYEPTGRANARPMTGSAKQSMARHRKLDGFVASLLAITRKAFRTKFYLIRDVIGKSYAEPPAPGSEKCHHSFE
jgi:hypothetical protein